MPDCNQNGSFVLNAKLPNDHKLSHAGSEPGNSAQPKEQK